MSSLGETLFIKQIFYFISKILGTTMTHPLKERTEIGSPCLFIYPWDGLPEYFYVVAK